MGNNKIKTGIRYNMPDLNKSVLLVQKGKREIDSLMPLLKEIGCETTVIGHVPDAMDHFRNNPPHLVIISAICSGGSAYDFCRFVREESITPEVPIIVTSPIISGTLQLEVKTRWGADDFVVLPSPIMILMKTILYYLGEVVGRPRTDLSLQSAMRNLGKTHKKRTHKSRNKLPNTGPISQIGLERILVVIGAAKRSGTLLFNNVEEQFSLMIKDGQLVRLDSNFIPSLSLGQVVIDNNMINEAVISPYRKRAAEGGELLGKLVMEAGLLKKEQVLAALVFQFIEKTIRIFQWESGNYNFKNADIKVSEDFPVQVPIGKLLLAWHKRIFTNDQFNKLYNDKMKEPLRLNEGGPFKLTDLDLPLPQKRLILSVDGKKNLFEILNHPEVEPNIMKSVLHTLFVLKLVKGQTI